MNHLNESEQVSNAPCRFDPELWRDHFELLVSGLSQITTLLSCMRPLPLFAIVYDHGGVRQQKRVIRFDLDTVTMYMLQSHGGDESEGWKSDGWLSEEADAVEHINRLLMHVDTEFAGKCSWIHFAQNARLIRERDSDVRRFAEEWRTVLQAQ